MILGINTNIKVKLIFIEGNKIEKSQKVVLLRIT